jgi:hypothetical protein
VGVIIAGIVIGGVELAVFGDASPYPGILVFGYIMFLLIYILLREILKGINLKQLLSIIKGMGKDGHQLKATPIDHQGHGERYFQICIRFRAKKIWGVKQKKGQERKLEKINK